MIELKIERYENLGMVHAFNSRCFKQFESNYDGSDRNPRHICHPVTHSAQVNFGGYELNIDNSNQGL